MKFLLAGSAGFFGKKLDACLLYDRHDVNREMWQVVVPENKGHKV